MSLRVYTVCDGSTYTVCTNRFMQELTYAFDISLCISLLIVKRLLLSFCLVPVLRFQPSPFGCAAWPQGLGQNVAGCRRWHQCHGQPLCCTNSIPKSQILNLKSLHFFSLSFFLCCFYLNKDIKSGQSPLMHVVESNNADMVHFLIEVMRICGQGEKYCYSALLIVFGFLFPAHKLSFPHLFLAYIKISIINDLAFFHHS